MVDVDVYDLHCDLLSYLARDPARTPYDPIARCSLPQLKAGGVVFQTMAIYTSTLDPEAPRFAEKQFQHFAKLIASPECIKGVPTEKRIGLLPAIENASGLVTESEPLEIAFTRLAHYHKEFGPLLYLSLTWKEENRFGGGNLTTTGLKREGELLLEALAQHAVPIDFSHTSDALAWDILNYIDKRRLKLPVLASHSNFRAVTDDPRNLPDEIAKELFRRGGVVGLNFVHRFMGREFISSLKRHVEHASHLGGGTQLALGADFFYAPDFSEEGEAYFHPEYGDASCYPKIWSQLDKTLGVGAKILVDASLRTRVTPTT